jgi:hypothetical protein
LYLKNAAAAVVDSYCFHCCTPGLYPGFNPLPAILLPSIGQLVKPVFYD